MLSKLFEDMIGIPYVKDGRDCKTGLDCFGLVLEASKRMGFQTVDLNDHNFLNQLFRNNKIDYESFVKIGFVDDSIPTDNEQFDSYYEEIKKPEPGCMVLFYSRFPFTSHVGIMLDDCNQFIHVSRNKLTCIERLNSVLWKGKVKGFYRWTKKLL